MNKLIAIAIGAVLLLLLLIFSTTYTVSFHEVAIRHTFGESSVDSVKMDAGLKWKLPVVQDSAKYDTRLQVKETALEEISTADGLQVVVRSYLLWQIDMSTPEGPLAFDRAFGSMEDAAASLHDPLVTAMTGALGRYRFDELIGPNHRLEQAEEQIAANLAGLLDKGIKPVSVGISQLLLPERTTNSVSNRMKSTRGELAAIKRSEGNAKAAGLQAEAATLADKIRAFAELRAADIRSQAAEKSGEYLAQMSEEEELAIFLVWLDTLEASLSESSTFILGTDFAPWHLMRATTSVGSNGIPKASRDSFDEAALVADRDAEEDTP